MPIKNYFFNNPNKDFFVFAGVLISIVVLSAGALLWWQRYNDPSRAQQAALEEYQQQVEEAYRNDTYGGSTPEETLHLFVEALKKEDIELASKYFALDDILSREKWVGYLEGVKKQGLLAQMANDITLRAKSAGSSYVGNYAFEIYNSDGSVAVTIEMELSPISKIWKIESL